MSKTANLIHALLLAAVLGLATSSAFADSDDFGGDDLGGDDLQIVRAIPEPTAALVFALGLGTLVATGSLRKRP